MPRLVVEKGVDKGKEVLVTPALSIVVGREVSIAPGNIRLTDTMVSRTQFRIVCKDGGYFLVDEDSRNGTFVNGNRVKEERLDVGAKIELGETMMSFLADTEETKRGGRVGQMIGGYRVVERVGRGGMGTVYKALQLSLNRVVALKLLADELVRDQSFINLFIQEARAAAQLNHPNIAQVYDVNRVAERDAYIYYFSMEFLPNGSVQDHLAKEKKVTPKRATRIILDAARGLEYAEKKKIVHRDIKPDNLMIGEDGIVKICDLGLAKKLDPAINVKDDKEQGCVFGTPHYVAPEQALGKPADHRSDIYSLGSTFYRILAGQTPYQGASAREIVIAKVKTEPVPLVQMDPTIPANLVTVVEKMMKKNPDERYQSASEVVLALEALKSELEGGPTTMTTMPTPSTPMEAPPLAQRVLVPAFMVLVMGALGAAGYFGYRHFEDQGNGNGNGNGNGGNPNPPIVPVDDPAKLKAFAKIYSDAETFERAQMNPNHPGSVKDAIQKYEDAKKLTLGSKFAGQAQEAVDRLRKRLTEISAAEALRKVEEEKKLLDDLLSSKKSRKEMEEGLKSRCAEIRRQVEAITKNYEGTAPEGSARKLLEAANKAAGAFATSAEAYDKALKTAVDLKGQRKYGAAIKSLEDFRWSIEKGTWFERQAGDDAAILRTESDAAWNLSVEQPVSEKIAAADFAGAREILAREADLYDMPQFRDKAKAIAEKIDFQEKQRNEAAFNARKEEDLVVFETAWVLGLPHLPPEENYRFDRAHKVMAEARKGIQTDEVGKFLDDRADLLARVGALKSALIDRINGVGGLTMKKRTARLERHQQTVTFVQGGADETGVSVDLPNPKSTIKADWSFWSPKKIRAIIVAGWELSAEDRLALGLFMIESSTRETELWAEASEDLEVARSLSDGGKDPRTWAVAGAWIGRLASLRGGRDEQMASMCLRVGAKAIEAERWNDAVAAYEWIQGHLDKTDTYRANGEDVRAKLAEARANAPK